MPARRFACPAVLAHDRLPPRFDPAAIAALTELGATNGYIAEATEDPAAFTADNLARFRVVVFLMTTGDPLDDAGQAAFEAWIAGGGNWVGVHSAADTEYDWPFYGELVGAYFKQHPAIQPATVNVEVADHPATAGLPSPWMRTDEWYDFQTNPRATATVLVTIDESTYTGGTMGADHPLVWAHATAGGGRAIYTEMGHTTESYADPLFRAAPRRRDPLGRRLLDPRRAARATSSSRASRGPAFRARPSCRRPSRRGP